jgi:nucleotide-binding universal stress UspA family protein
MFNTFLIPVDGSAPAKRAAKYGLELAVRYDASVELLHVVKKGVLSDSTHRNKKKEQGEAILEEAAELDIEGHPSIETHLVVGNPGKAITAHVTDRDIDFVVMGRHGRSGVGEHLFGTVAERVLRGSDAPVLTVPGDTVERETGRTYENILLTTDGSDVAEQAAPYGADIAKRTGATLHFLTVVDIKSEAGPFDAGGVSEEYIERLEKRGQDALDRLVEQIDTTNIDIRSSLTKGTPSAEIDAYARENEIDLVVMASQGETNIISQRLGSTARRVLRTVEKPVLVIPQS